MLAGFLKQQIVKHTLGNAVALGGNISLGVSKTDSLVVRRGHIQLMNFIAMPEKLLFIESQLH